MRFDCVNKTGCHGKLCSFALIVTSIRHHNSQPRGWSDCDTVSSHATHGHNNTRVYSLSIYSSPTLGCVTQPHDASPLINVIAPFQPVSRDPINPTPRPDPARVMPPPWRPPMNQSHRPNPASVAYGPMACPHESIPFPRSRIGASAVLLIAGLQISTLSQPPTGFLPKPVAILLTPGPTPPPPPFWF